MEVHRPRERMHGTRDFLKEVGIIVLGVLIALGAEQIAEAVHWAHEVREAHAAFRTEMDGADRNFAFRVAAESCVTRRLDALANVTERVANHAAVPHLGSVQPDVANAFVDGDWQAYRASQVVTHLSHPELEEYGAYYSQLEHVRDWIATEHEAWDQLERLQGDPARLGSEDIATLRGALARARTANRYISMMSAEELQRATGLGAPSAVADAQRVQAACMPLPVDVAAIAND